MVRIDVEDPVLKAIQSIHQSVIIGRKSSLDAAAVLHERLPRIAGACLQTIGRQWRSLLIDEEVLDGDWKDIKIEEFWRTIGKMESYSNLGQFMLEVTALPQSTAAVERTFSKMNCNKTKLRNRRLTVRTLEAVIRVSESFPGCFEVSDRISSLYSNARRLYMERYDTADREAVDNIEQYD